MMEETALMLDLSPEQVARLQEYAAAKGISVGELIDLTFPPRGRQVTPSLQDLVRSRDDAIRAAVLSYVSASPEEVARRNAPSIALLEAKLAEAANATPEEIAAAEAEWETHKRSMNENRRLTGERPVYAETPGS